MPAIAKISQRSRLAADKAFRLSEEQFPPVETPTLETNDQNYRETHFHPNSLSGGGSL
jgi:hypothetical protein